MGNYFPLVSIGCATFNGEKTLRRSLDSLVSQDYPSIEIVICDDGSTDDTKKICEEYARSYRVIRFYENEENLGIAENCNKIFSLSSGKYFMWADQDDFRDIKFVSSTVPILEKFPSAVLCHSYTGVLWGQANNLMHVNTINSISGDRNLLRRYWTFSRRYSDTAIYGLLRTDILRDTNLWRQDVGSANSLLFELLLRGEFRQVPEILYYYSAKGLQFRPSPSEELGRSGVGGRAEKFRFPPCIALARNQLSGIDDSSVGVFDKNILKAMVVLNLISVILFKAIYRFVDFFTSGNVPMRIDQICGFMVFDIADINFKINDKNYLPDGWRCKKFS